MSLRDSRGGNHATSSWSERVLLGLGAHPAFADAVLGDLAEERGRREAVDGPVAAQCWYVREAFRSAPHLLCNALRHGGAGGRARAVAVLAGAALVPVAVATALLLRDGPPARLVLGVGSGTNGIIVNSVRPVRLSMRALDARGRVLGDTGVRYRWMSGAPVGVSAAGVVTCAQPGDATVRASLGDVTTSAVIRCRPVNEVRAPPMLDIVVGDSTREVPFEAFDMEGRRVTLLAGQFTVGDSSIVSLEGQRIRARAAGSTWVTARFGDRTSFSSVHVYERVQTLEGIRPGQHAASPIRLVGGEMRQWRLPAGGYFLAILPDGDEQARPQLAVVDASCMQSVGHLLCAARRAASVIAYYPQDLDQAQVLRGTLAVWREEDP
jgi:hypothetical protein